MASYRERRRRATDRQASPGRGTWLGLGSPSPFARRGAAWGVPRGQDGREYDSCSESPRRHTPRTPPCTSLVGGAAASTADAAPSTRGCRLCPSLYSSTPGKKQRGISQYCCDGYNMCNEGNWGLLLELGSIENIILQYVSDTCLPVPLTVSEGLVAIRVMQIIKLLK